MVWNTPWFVLVSESHDQHSFMFPELYLRSELKSQYMPYLISAHPAFLWIIIASLYIFIIYIYATIYMCVFLLSFYVLMKLTYSQIYCEQIEGIAYTRFKLVRNSQWATRLAKLQRREHMNPIQCVLRSVYKLITKIQARKFRHFKIKYNNNCV